jgi:cytochrome bd-type quinol oxidase subunit 2
MNMSYKEKGLIASLGITLLIFGWYLYGAFSNLSLNSELPGFVDIIILLVWIVVLETIIQSFLAIKNKSQLEDERDKLIEKVSYRYSYGVLSVCIWFLMVGVLLNKWFDSHLMLTTPYAMFHLLLLSFVLSEVIRFGTQLYYYRKGV